MPGDELCDEFAGVVEDKALGQPLAVVAKPEPLLEHEIEQRIEQELEQQIVQQQHQQQPLNQQQEYELEQQLELQQQPLKQQQEYELQQQQQILSPEKEKSTRRIQSPLSSPHRITGSPLRPPFSPQRPPGSPMRPVQKVVFSPGQEVQVAALEGKVQVQEEVSTFTVEEKQDGEQVQEMTFTTEGDEEEALPSNSIQIIDENGQKIVILNRGEGELGSEESDLDTDNEDREFTVIVEEEEIEEEEEEGGNRDIHIDENNVIEAESIEDILAQFESESAPRSVACPNCRKCFVSAHFLNLHISNNSTMCDLCNTQCCSQVNLR